MATVTGLTKERMLTMEAETVTSGLVDINGNLILYTRAGVAIDAGWVKGETGPRGADSTYDVGPFTGGTAYYSRLGTVDGGSALSGASFEFLLSGLGGYGTAKRSTILIHITQRGSNVITARTWGWGLEDSTLPLKLYTRQISEFVFEVWGLFAPYAQRATLTLLAGHGSTVAIDSASTTAPTNLVEYAINKADSWDSLKDKPTSFTPSGHIHALTDITIVGIDASVNLNTLTTQGIYHQSSNANAASGTNYPMPRAGLLEVYKYATGTMVYQRYTTYDGYSGVFHREWYSTSWSPWREFDIVEDVSVYASMGSVTANAYIPIVSPILNGGFTSPNATTLVAPSTGTYQINVAQLISPASASYYQLRINDVTAYHAYTSGAMGDLHVHLLRKLTAGDTIRLYFQGSAPSSWGGTHSNLSIMKL